MTNIGGIRKSLELKWNSGSTKEEGTVGGNCVSPRAVRKAQAAMEYMMIIGMVLIILTPMVISIFQQIDVVSRSRQAEIAALQISSTANNLYAQGPGAKSTINIFLPDGYSSLSYVSGNVILIKVYISGGFNDVLKISTANLTGSLPADSGYKQITLEMLQNGTVMVS